MTSRNGKLEVAKLLVERLVSLSVARKGPKRERVNGRSE